MRSLTSFYERHLKSGKVWAFRRIGKARFPCCPPGMAFWRCMGSLARRGHWALGSLVNEPRVLDRLQQHLKLTSMTTKHEHSDYLYPFLLFSCGNNPSKPSCRLQQPTRPAAKTFKFLLMNTKQLQVEAVRHLSLARTFKKSFSANDGNGKRLFHCHCRSATSPSLIFLVSPLSPPPSAHGQPDPHPFTPLHWVHSSPKNDNRIIKQAIQKSTFSSLKQ